MANTSFGELKRRTLLGMSRTDGETLLAVEEAINTAHKVIASVKDYDCLMVLDTTNAVTVASQKLYHLETDLLLVRPKDIYSIRLMDDEESRKLTYVPFRELDERIPYTEQSGEGKPKWYTRRGEYIELYLIPDAAYDLYVMHSQWPAVLVDDTDLTPYPNIDHVIVSLAINIANEIQIGQITEWETIASRLLGLSSGEHATRPDEMLVAQPFTTKAPMPGEYWNNPWIKKIEE